MSLLNSGLYLVRIASLLYHIVDSGRRLEFLPTNIRKTRKPVAGMCNGDNELAFENRVEPRLSFPLGEYSSCLMLSSSVTAMTPVESGSRAGRQIAYSFGMRGSN